MNRIFKSFIALFLIATNSMSFAQEISFKNISINEGLPQSDVLDAKQDKSGYMWFATQGGGIAKYDGTTFLVYNQNKGLLSNFTNGLLIKNDSIFIATNKGLSILYKEKFTNYNAPKTNAIHQINGAVFLATEQGVYQFKKDFVAPIKIKLNIDLSSILAIDYFASFYWIQTQQTLYKSKTMYNPKFIQKASRNEISIFSQRKKKAYKKFQQYCRQQETQLIKVYKDAQQNTWLLTAGKGIYKSMPTSFQHFNKVSTKNIGRITAVHTNNGLVWFSSTKQVFVKDSVGIKIIDTYKQQFEPTTLTTDPKNNLWIGTKKKGIFIFRKNHDSLQTPKFKIERLFTENGFPNNKIRQIEIEKDTIWVLTKHAGIIKLDYDFNKGVVTKIRKFNRNNGLKEHAITSFKLYKNTIWYGTEKGDLGCITQNSVTHHTNILKKKLAINSIDFKDQDIFIGTLGAGVWTSNKAQIQQLKPLNNTLLSSLNVYQLLFDKKGYMWIGSEKGVDQLTIKKGKIIDLKHYNATDGFLGVETSLQTAINTSNNHLWFGTNNGISLFTPKNTTPIHQMPSLSFEKIEVDFLPLDSITRPIISGIIQLTPTQNNLSFSYKTVDLNYPERVKYQWKLNGITSKWTRANSANFPNLNAGNYVFTVVSKTTNGLVSPAKSLSFYIDKPLYRKNWFLWLCATALCFVLLLIVVSYIEKIKKRNKEIIDKLSLENHLIGLEQKALQLQMNPHFIFNVLNGIKALGNSGDKTEFNNTISQFATLLRGILHNSRLEEISLLEEVNSLKNYIALEQKMANFPFHFELNIKSPNLDIEEILIPPMLVQPFIENSIQHAFKEPQYPAVITVNFMVKNTYLICTVIDNGIGFKNGRTKMNHKSVAIQLTKERLKSLSKYSSLEITEITEKKQIKGTKVTLKIPLKTDF